MATRCSILFGRKNTLISPKMATSTVCLFFIASVFAVMSVHCSAGKSCTMEEMSADHLQKLAAANNELALNLHRKLAEGSTENVIFSPLSLSSAMGMLFYGSRGTTAEEIRSALGFTKAQLPDDVVHATYQRFMNEVLTEGRSDAYVVDSANAILVAQHLKVVPEYKSGMAELYHASVRDVDFANSGDVVRDINAWVKKVTRGKITQVLDSLDPSTILVILNAVYFKGTWQTQFKPEKTRPQPFFNNGLDSKTAEVPLMHMSARFRYAATDGVQALELPYKGNNISMVILLPDKRDGLPKLERTLTLETFNGVLKRLHSSKVIVSLPKFRAEFSEDLSGAFSALGAGEMFRPSANFSGMTHGKGVFVSQVIHKAVIEVNEEGSEAAAVTAVIATRMRPIFDAVPEFRADHPFLYFIVEKGSGSNMILFMGRVNSL